MIDLLRNLGLPVGISSVSGRIDEIIVIVHYLMLVLFVGWGIFFIVSLVKFRASKNKKASYQGVESHYSSVMEAAVAVIEIVILFGFAFPIWAERVNDIPDPRDSEHIRIVAQQYAWNIHYPGADGKFGDTKVELVDEQDNPIGLDRSSEFSADDFFTINQLHIPANKKIRVDLSSKDVIHNFKLPELRVSQDAIPGMVIPVHFTATMTSEDFFNTVPENSRRYDFIDIKLDSITNIKPNLYNIYGHEIPFKTLVKNGESLGPAHISQPFTDNQWRFIESDKRIEYYLSNSSVDALKNSVFEGRQNVKKLEIACAQLCGLGHYRMKGYLTIHEEDDYQVWLDEQAEYLEEEEEDDWGDEDDDWGDDEDW